MTPTTLTAVVDEDGSIRLPLPDASPGEVVRVTIEPLPNVADRPSLVGSGKGTVLYMADDFDAPLEDFKDYINARILLDTHTVL